jgi:hypothetical protein
VLAGRQDAEVLEPASLGKHPAFQRADHFVVRLNRAVELPAQVVHAVSSYPAIYIHLLAVSGRRDSLLAKEVAATTGPAAAQVTSAACCSVNDRESPWVTFLTDTWRARRAGTVSLMSGALAVGICGVVLASLSLGWQAAIYVLSGGRVKVRLLVGAMGNGAMVTKPAEDLNVGWLKEPASQGFTRPVVAVTVANVGRQPVNVARWGLKSGLGTSMYPIADIGPSLPHRLEVGDAATWAVDMETVQAFRKATNEALGGSQLDSGRRKSLIGRIEAEVRRPQGTDVVGIVELADGRPKLSQGTLR